MTLAAPVRGSGLGVRPVLVAGVSAPLAAVALVALYVSVVAALQDWGHAWDLLGQDAWFVAPIAGGFGLQAGMFLYMRSLRAMSRPGTAMAACSSGISGVAMAACCAHHISDLVPVLGLSGAAVFVTDFKTPLAVVGIVSNGVGLLLMGLRLRRIREALA